MGVLEDFVIFFLASGKTSKKRILMKDFFGGNISNCIPSKQKD